ncbi:MAG: hypothetical protein WBP34_05940, partial [Thermoanaerobaculia bacterium]
MNGPTHRTPVAVLLLLAGAACSGLKDESESLPPQSVSQVTLDDSEFEEYVVAQEEEPVDEEPEAAAVTEELDLPALEDAVVDEEPEVAAVTEESDLPALEDAVV